MTTATVVGLEQSVERLRSGATVLIEHGERAVLVVPAALVTEETIRTFESLTAAPMSLALDAETFDALGLGTFEQTPEQESPVGLPVDVGATGIEAMSRRARAHTIAQLGQGAATSVITPGHVPTVRSSAGALLTRVGLVEAAIDLVALAGFRSSAMIAFLVDPSGEAAVLDRVALADVRTAALEAAGGTDEEAVRGLFIGAMSRLVAPVAVITCSPDGVTPVGLVVSSLTSYSSEPPSVVFSVALSTRSYPVLHGVESFAVHILAHGQEELVSAFASRSSDKFAGVDWAMVDGVPVLPNVQAVLRCRKVGEMRLGDHALFVGGIVDGEASDREPMVYFDRKFQWELAL